LWLKPLPIKGRWAIKACIASNSTAIANAQGDVLRGTIRVHALISASTGKRGKREGSFALIYNSEMARGVTVFAFICFVFRPVFC
jgi:hypothetical protein